MSFNRRAHILSKISRPASPPIPQRRLGGREERGRTSPRSSPTFRTPRRAPGTPRARVARLRRVRVAVSDSSPGPACHPQSRAILRRTAAGVAKPVDARDLKSLGRKAVRVRVPPPAPFEVPSCKRHRPVAPSPGLRGKWHEPFTAVRRPCCRGDAGCTGGGRAGSSSAFRLASQLTLAPAKPASTRPSLRSSRTVAASSSIQLLVDTDAATLSGAIKSQPDKSADRTDSCSTNRTVDLRVRRYGVTDSRSRGWVLGT